MDSRVMGRQSKNANERRAYVAVRRIFGRYGVDIADPKMTEKQVKLTVARMTADEYRCVSKAFALVMAVNGKRDIPKPIELTKEQRQTKLQEMAYYYRENQDKLPGYKHQ
jgi:hypothetical protein